MTDETETIEDNDFQQELRNLINKHSRENGSDTPDFILAEYLDNCLTTFEIAIRGRNMFYSPHPEVKTKDQQ